MGSEPDQDAAALAAQTSTPAFHRALKAAVQAGLPQGVQLAAANYARSSASSYWLLRWSSAAMPPIWLTLRIATHPHWLTHVQQVEVVRPALPDLTGLSAAVRQALASPAAAGAPGAGPARGVGGVGARGGVGSGGGGGSPRRRGGAPHPRPPPGRAPPPGISSRRWN
ncbi:hypothetical protein [Schleiferilactobacillus harbinensis]|uniref:hypothetical protein n=1 Tax=Schleiferilactobacillus harbinensis TaxID=304207 RepID=UPI0039EBF5CA